MTGVQTCALPISLENNRDEETSCNLVALEMEFSFQAYPGAYHAHKNGEIGRASCRERV